MTWRAAVRNPDAEAVAEGRPASLETCTIGCWITFWGGKRCGQPRHRVRAGLHRGTISAAWNPTCRMRGPRNPACNEDAQR